MGIMHILTRRPGTVDVYPFGVNSSSEANSVSSVPAQSAIPSSDGTQMFVPSPAAVDVLAATSGQLAYSIPEPDVLLVALSSRGGYLVTVQRPMLENGTPTKNLKVWRLASQECVLGLPQKGVGKDAWPVLHWAPDDSHLFHLTTNMIHIYNEADSFATYRKLPMKGVAGVAVSPGSTPRLAAFVPEVKSTPGSAAIFDYGTVDSVEPLVRKSFFRCTGSTLLWNSRGTALLALASSDVDATNQSYYGEQKLHFLPSEAKRADLACLVPVGKDGPVHDVQWAPDGSHFCVIAGYMPAKVTLFDSDCKPVFDFGSGPYNMVRWSAFGRVLALAGFGNLPGDIVFFERKTGSGICKQIAAVRSPAVSAEWSPDGRHLLTAITAPRLRVDNNYKVLDYCGRVVAEQHFDVLLEATWLPAAPGMHKDRALSPSRLATASGSGTSNAPVTGIAARPAAYRPPGSRGAVGGNFSMAFDPNDAPGKFQAAVAARHAGLPPGADPSMAPKSAAAAAKKTRKRSTKKATADSAAAGDCAGASGDEEEAATLQGTVSTSGAAHRVDELPVAGLSLQEAAAPVEDANKRIRALQKKLRQIEQIKEKRNKSGESALEPEQRQKLASEAALLDELHALGGTL